MISAARKPRSASRARNFFDVDTSGRKTTVRRPLHASAISSAMRSRYGSSAVPTSSAEKSPCAMRAPVRSILSGTVCASMGQR